MPVYDYTSIASFNPDPIKFRTYFDDSSLASDSILMSGRVFQSDYMQVQKTYLVDSTKNVFLTYFGLEVELEKYKLTRSTDACSENIDYQELSCTAITSFSPSYYENKN